MIPYASSTGTKTTLSTMREAGWRILISATGQHNAHGFPYALDNGAFTSYQQGKPFSHSKFRTLLRSHGSDADWVVLPDVVADRDQTLELSMSYLKEFGDRYRWLLAVQDGMTPQDLGEFTPLVYGFAIGGTTEWKERSAPMWGSYAKSHEKYLHMLRVNTARRIALAAAAGCHSFDGTSVIKFPKTLGLLDFHRRQSTLDFI
jgi:hypothetical protein